jgi:hypothetical protein
VLGNIGHGCCLFCWAIFYTWYVVYIGKRTMLEMFLTVFTAIAVSNGGNFPIAAIRRYFVEESRRVPEIGALEPFWGGLGTGATAIFFYVVEHPQVSLLEVGAVTVALIVPTIIAGLPTYYAARGEWRGLVKASAPIVVALPLLVALQTILYRITGLSSAVVSAVTGVVFTIVLVSAWGFAIRRGLLRSTTRDLASERVASLESTLNQERTVLAQLNSTLQAVQRSREQQLAELNDASNRVAELAGELRETDQYSAQLSRELEQERTQVAQLTAALATAHAIRDEQTAEAREAREQLAMLQQTMQELAADNAQLRAQLSGES